MSGFACDPVASRAHRMRRKNPLLHGMSQFLWGCDCCALKFSTGYDGLVPRKLLVLSCGSGVSGCVTVRARATLTYNHVCKVCKPRGTASKSPQALRIEYRLRLHRVMGKRSPRQRRVCGCGGDLLKKFPGSPRKAPNSQFLPSCRMMKGTNLKQKA